MIENPRGRNWSPELDRQDELKRVVSMPDAYYLGGAPPGTDYVVVWPRTGEAARWIRDNTAQRIPAPGKIPPIQPGEPVTMTLATSELMQRDGFRFRAAPARLVRRWRGS